MSDSNGVHYGEGARPNLNQMCTVGAICCNIHNLQMFNVLNLAVMGCRSFFVQPPAKRRRTAAVAAKKPPARKARAAKVKAAPAKGRSSRSRSSAAAKEAADDDSPPTVGL